MRTQRLLATLSLLSLLSGCGLVERFRGGDEDETGGEANEAGAAEEGEGQGEDQGEGAVAETTRSLAALTGPERFKHWSPQHAFLPSSTVVANAVSEDEILVATNDAHVGISKDGGETWEWVKAEEAVRDLAGYPGGPYVLLHEGAISISDEGLLWRRLPRYSPDSLIDVVAADIGLVAIGKNGGFVHITKDGSSGQAGWMPDKFKAKAVTELNGAVLAWSGKKGYGTTDGVTWTELEQLPPMPDGRTFLTSAGSCSIGKVGKRRGVVCKVSGTAHGIGEDFVVESKGVVSLTRDGGDTWITAKLPFKNANSIFGASGGPYYAVGNSGAIAISKDGGNTWVDQKWQESANLLDGVADGDNIVIVGAKGTLIYSTDGGDKWDYSVPPAGKNLSWVAKIDDRYVATDGRKYIASQNVVDWAETEAVETPGKPGSCEDDGPIDGEQCRYGVDTTTPEDMPEVRGLFFDDDIGVAVGDDALVAVTQDGGASWIEAHGFDLGRAGATAFSVAGEQVLVTDGSGLWTTSDAGASWVPGELLRNYKINDVHVSSEGLLVAAAKDEILRAKLDPKTWLPAQDEPIKGDWRSLYEVAGVLYAAGSRGELRRSEDGDTWAEVVTGIPSPVIDMAGEGQNVWATTAPTRKANNVLLRSEDGGAHFIVVQEMPGATDAPDLRVEGEAVMWADLVSRDQGQTWRREIERYFPGLIDVGDDSGMKITNLVYRYSSDRLYVVTGPGEHDWVRVDSAYTEGGVLECNPSSGCWMLASGALYRPLAK
jgi:photosystem II stability/assembly factor-like uncharacterized protein